MAAVRADRTPHGLLLTCQGCGARYVPLYQEQADQFAAVHAACPSYYGAGDLVARIAKPIARFLGMDPDCQSCAEREALLNRHAPRVWRR